MRKRAPRSTAEILLLWPSPLDLALDVNVEPVTVRAWRARGVPAKRWPELVSAAKARGIRGVNLERLAHFTSRERKAR